MTRDIVSSMQAPPGTRPADEKKLQTVLLNGHTWDEYTDGRVWRLKRGRHFKGDLRVAANECTEHAREIGRAVRILRDDFHKIAYLWVQFTDYEIPIGAPCPRCGSRKVVRTHEHFGRCPVCSAVFSFKGDINLDAPRPRAPDADGTVPGYRPTSRQLEFYSDVEIQYLETEDNAELWYGHGWTPHGLHALLLVEYLFGADGQRMPHAHIEGRWVTRVRAFPAWPFYHALDLDRLFPDDGEGAPEPPPIGGTTDLP